MYIEKNKLNKYISFWLALLFWIVSLMIVVGGLTRLTDSGLSITQWQLFSGILPPFNDNDWENYFNLYKQIPEFKLQNYLMTLDEFKVIFWWEWGHRFLGRLIGIIFFVPLIYFYFKIGFNKTKSLFFIFFLICLQGFLGWYMVSSGLIERVDVSHFRLSIHLIVAFVILSLIYWNYLYFKEVPHSEIKLSKYLILFFLLMIFIQIILGAFVAGMDAGKIYNSWPLMGTNYFPDDNNPINLLKISAFSDPSLVQFMHRNMAYIIIILYLFILYKVSKNRIKQFYKILLILGVFLLIQVILGILTLLFGAHIFFASMHQISSIFLVSSCIYLLFLNTKLTNGL